MKIPSSFLGERRIYVGAYRFAERKLNYGGLEERAARVLKI